MGMMRVQDKPNLTRLAVWLLGLVMVLAACGGDTSGADSDGASTGTGDVPSAGQSPSAGSGDASTDDGAEATADGTSQAMATLVVGDDTYTWEGNQWTYCEIGGLFPANAEFQTEQDKRAGNWVQFIDRGDGGIHFSAILEGEEFAGTGSGEAADEITSNGFTYTGTLNRGGETLDASLEVSC